MKCIFCHLLHATKTTDVRTNWEASIRAALELLALLLELVWILIQLRGQWAILVLSLIVVVYLYGPSQAELLSGFQSILLGTQKSVINYQINGLSH